MTDEVDRWIRAYQIAHDQAAANGSRARQLQAALEELIAAIDAPRYGDDSIWDDLNGYGEDGGPLGRARKLISATEPV